MTYSKKQKNANVRLVSTILMIIGIVGVINYDLTSGGSVFILGILIWVLGQEASEEPVKKESERIYGRRSDEETN